MTNVNMPRAPAKPYTLAEKRRILQYIISHKAYHQVKGNVLWIRMASEFPDGHSWQSLKEHFKKQLLQSLTLPEFKLTEAEIASFRRGYASLSNLKGTDQSKHRSPAPFYKLWAEQEDKKSPCKAARVATAPSNGEGEKVSENKAAPNTCTFCNKTAPSRLPDTNEDRFASLFKSRSDKDDDALLRAAVVASKEGTGGESDEVLEMNFTPNKDSAPSEMPDTEAAGTTKEIVTDSPGDQSKHDCKLKPEEEEARQVAVAPSNVDEAPSITDTFHEGNGTPSQVLEPDAVGANVVDSDAPPDRGEEAGNKALPPK